MTNARTRTALSGLLSALTLSTVALVAMPTVAAHDGGSHSDGQYVPPPVVEPDRTASGAFRHVSRAAAHEVWLVDQSDTRAGYGGTIHIYDGADLRSDASGAPAEAVDLGGKTAELCLASTGANPVRPHMLDFSPGDTHAVLAFVASGHTVIFDGPSREPLACFRTEASTTGARQAHAAIPTPDGQYLLVANQNGKKLERIRTDFATNTFVQEPAATLDLATGLTPNGIPVQTPGNVDVRPDNAPICPFVPSTGFPAYVSLRGGGMLAVDPYSTPLRIVAEYPASEVPRDGCGFTEARGWVYANGGSNPGNLAGWSVYRFPLGGRETYDADNPPSTPAVEMVEQDTRGPRDAHGVVTVRGKYVWAFDRAAHVLQVYDAKDAAPVTTTNLRSPFSAVPAVDIVGEAPDGRAVYAATRGPNPLTGSHAATGDSPGLLVLEVLRDGREGVVRGHASISNMVGAVERGDPHGLAVRSTR